MFLRRGADTGRRPATRPAFGDKSAANWVFVPLRMFLGVTFVYAGLQKLADRWFFSSSAPSSLPSQLHATAHSSPIGGLVSPLASHALVLGLLIAFGELAVGVATLAGLWARPAAAAGLLLSLGFLFTVSWHTRPYYYGADVVFVFAWTPLVIAGAGPWSLDCWARTQARSRAGLPRSNPVTLEFAAVQRLCGVYDHGRCRARGGSRCRSDGCPVLVDIKSQRAAAEIDRRSFLQKAGAAGWLGTAALLGGGLVAVLGRLVLPHSSSTPPAVHLTAPPGTDAPTTTPATSSGSSPATAAPTRPAVPTTSATSPPTTARPAGTTIGAAATVPVGGAARFRDPATGDPAYVVHPSSGRFLAFDAVCTHAGCTVAFEGSIFQCPCHGAQFDATTGQVIRGPARRPLPPIPIQEGGDGNLYAV